MTCSRPKCFRKRRQNNTLCNFHYDAARREREANGGRKCGRIPSRPVVAHINRLREAGIGNRRIAELSGVTVQSIQRMKRHDYAYADTAHKILSIPVPSKPHADSVADCAKVPLIGTTRRIQALNCLGWTSRDIAQRLNVDDDMICKWGNGLQRFIFASKAREVDAVFKGLQLSHAPESVASKRAKLRAARKNWAGPLCWDNIDDPTEQPNFGDEPDFLHAVEDARQLGRTDKQIAESLGLKKDTLQQRIRRLERAS